MTPDDGIDIAALIDSALPIQPESVDLRTAGLTQREALLTVCDEARVWRSPEGDAYASVPVHDHIEHHPVGSKAFRNWMLCRLASRFTVNSRPASANENAVREARAAVEAQALMSPNVHRPSLRVAEHDAAIYIDLGFSEWSAVRVDANGWNVVLQAPIPILRGRRTGPFPNPNAAADFAPLRSLLRHLDEDAFVLLVAWCLGAMLPEGPYPILVLGGEQGSGKSTLARLAQRVTDPVNGDLLQPPATDRDLIACARTNRVLSFDNLSALTGELADSLCRLATGSEIGGRALFSDYDLATFAACRPIVMNGIPDLASRGDLADRALVLRLPVLPDRITERQWRAAVNEVMPHTFAALLDALSCGLARLEATPTPDYRMADFARFIVAAEPALPWPPGAFLDAVRRVRRQANVSLAEGDAVASAVKSFVDDRGRDWSGLMSELHAVLTQRHLSAGRGQQDWPANSRWFSDRLRRAAPALRSLGIDVAERRTSRGTMATLHLRDPAATPAPSAQPAQSRAVHPTARGADDASASAEPDPWAT
jgi:putative DNA primase/helicase